MDLINRNVATGEKTLAGFPAAIVKRSDSDEDRNPGEFPEEDARENRKAKYSSNIY